MTQRHGVRLDPDRRMILARKAFAYSNQGYKRMDIAALLDVSEPTVRNLINYGRRLNEQEQRR